VELRFAPPLEPPRREWFLAGTETRSVELADAARVAPRILSPPDAATIALDPDIPAASQQLLLAARSSVADHVLVLDGEVLGSAGRIHRWSPTPGRHELALRAGSSAEAIDSVAFEVRGAVR
jgi:penicillin-binding protein 1C